MNQPEKELIGVLVLILTAMLLIAPTMAAADGTTELHIVKYASDEETILNETTVDYHWLEENLPIQGDGVTRYYHQGPVFEGVWEERYPDEEYDGWNPREDINISILYKGDFGAVMGTDIKDICDSIGGAEDGDVINARSRDGYTRTYPYSVIYEPDPRQGPAVLCWYSGASEGPDMQDGKEQGEGYPDTGYIAGMRLIFFADTSTNPWGWHVFGNTDMKECWDEEDWNYGGQYPSAAGTSPMWVNEVRIFSQIDPPSSPDTNFTADVNSGTAPLTVRFNDTSTENPTEWSWDFGDGETSEEQHPVHTFTAAGTYNVTLTATNSVDSSSSTKDGFIIAKAYVRPDYGLDDDGSDDYPVVTKNTTENQVNATPDGVNTNTSLVNSTCESGQTSLTNRTYSFEDQDICEICISAENLSKSLNISCETTAMPKTVPEAPGMVYHYYTITPCGANVTINSAEIRFSVPLTWIKKNRIDIEELSLCHYNGNWTLLPTTYISTVNGSCLYRAVTPGFSLFAISGEQIEFADATTRATMETTMTIAPDTGSEPEEEPPVSFIMCFVILVAAIGVSIWCLRLINHGEDKKEE